MIVQGDYRKIFLAGRIQEGIETDDFCPKIFTWLSKGRLTTDTAATATTYNNINKNDY